MKNNIDISVIAPFYNRKKYVLALLDAVRVDVEESGLRCEIIIVDNNSTDGIVELLKKAQKEWPESMPLRIYNEPLQGAHYARWKGVAVSKGEYIAFLDSDNLPRRGWLRASYEFGQSYPKAGIWAGKCLPVFEESAPAYTVAILGYLAIIDKGDAPIKHTSTRRVFMPGGGSVVRRNAWVENVPHVPFFGGRRGNSLVAGEDYEFQTYIIKGGWELWYNPAMVVDHLIPQYRLEPDYIAKLARANGLIRYFFRTELASPWKRPLLFVAGIFKDSVDLIKFVFIGGKTLSNDLERRLEFNFRLGILLSPFYIWYRSITRFIEHGMYK